MNWKKTALAGLVLLSSTVTVAATGVDGQAASYRRTKMTKISHKDYYSLSKKGWTYKISGSTKHARLKRNHHLINYTTSTWQRSKRTYLYKHGKKTCYYYVKNTKNGATGWVWSGYLKAGKNYQATTAKKVATKTYYRNPQRAGKFYQLKGSNRYVRFTTGRALKTNTAYQRSRQRTVYKKGKKVSYYFIKQGRQSGWVWSKYLTTQVPTARLGITKRGRTVAGVSQYQASGNVMVPYQTKNFSTVSVPHAYMMQKFTYQPAANYHELKTLQPTANVFETTKHQGPASQYGLRSTLYLPLATATAKSVATNPQSAAFSKDDHYLYVMYVTSSDGNSDHQRGWVVRYDWQRLTALGARKNGQMALVRQAALDQYHQRATSQLDRDVLACIKIGPRFTTGHAQSMALNPRTNELWFV
ncbi:hypothetical protein [Lactiplantibacillus plajomi]|uniref:D-alanyl-D-alanine carboxypeptidase n=1 Tax=Lactiplantibacillus plajomi TaxID=1457217 RepID=A0ABV6K2G6_9LACO|nr:hypothetical protein [Lactiplantibacillus plajomi]